MAGKMTLIGFLARLMWYGMGRMWMVDRGSWRNDNRPRYLLWTADTRECPICFVARQTLGGPRYDNTEVHTVARFLGLRDETAQAIAYAADAVSDVNTSWRLQFLRKVLFFSAMGPRGLRFAT